MCKLRLIAAWCLALACAGGVSAAPAAELAGCGSGSTANASPLPDRLRFEHIGEQDAAGPPFDVLVGRPSEASYTLLPLSANCYCAVLRLLARPGYTIRTSARPPGTFEVTALAQGRLVSTMTVPPAAMRDLVRLMRGAYHAEAAPVPAMLTTQAMLLGLGR